MKTTTIFAAIAALFIGTAASADDFDNTTASITVEVDRYDFTITGTENDGYTSFGVGAEVLAYDITDTITGELSVSGTSFDGGDLFSIGIDHTTTYNGGNYSVWGTMELEYVFDRGNFDDGTTLATPTVGADYDLNSYATAWAEVGYTWDASNDWEQQGGVAEVGVDFDVMSNVTMTPSVSHTFDTNDDHAQLNLDLTLRF